MKLIGSLTSPYVRKVRVVLAEKKLDYRFELEDPWSADTTISDFNPLGKVPCLIMEDGGAVFDSRVIVEHLDGLSPNARLIPQNGRARIEVKTWEAIADGLCDAAIATRLENARPAEQRSSANIARQLKKLDDSLAAMENALGDKTWCVGQSVTLADISATVALAYLDLRFADIDWRARHPELARHFEKIAARPSLADTAYVT